MNPAKKLFYSAVNMLPMNWLQDSNPNGIILPYQHIVSDQAVPHVRNLYPFKNVKAFEKDLDVLAKNFQPLTAEQIIRHINEASPLPKRSFCLSFDDGFREVAEVIVPLLEKKGIPAIFFLNPAFLDNKELFYKLKISLIIDALHINNYQEVNLNLIRDVLEIPRGSNLEDTREAIYKIKYPRKEITDELGKILGLDWEAYLKSARPFMTWDQVGDIVRKGFEIGGHSIDHPYYDMISYEEQIHQTLGSVTPLVERFNLPYKIFAFPHYDSGVSKKFFNELLTGTDPKLDLVFGTANHKQDISPKILHRFNFERPETSSSASVKGILAYTKLTRMLNKHLVNRD